MYRRRRWTISSAILTRPHGAPPGEPIEITVRLYLTFRTGRFRSEARRYPAGATAAAVARQLALADTEIGMVLINDRQAELEQELNPGDTLSLFPVVGGG